MKLFILFVLMIFTAYGQEACYQEARNSCREISLTQTVERIIKEQPESIAFYHNHKYYLKHEHIQVTSSGIALLNASSCIPIEALFSDSMGCYLESDFNESQVGPVLRPIICKNCGAGWFYSDFRKVCPKCGTPP